MDISASTSIGEGPRTPRMEVQTAQACKSLISLSTGCQVYSTCYPLAAPSEVNNVVISVISNDSIFVQWDPPLRPNGILTYYDIVVFNDLTGFNFSTKIHSSNGRDVAVTGLRKKIPCNMCDSFRKHQLYS